ncbi:copper resistance protein CopC [Ureibacillus sp. GCM10028918]|uniref:copper resistance CopC family protein n=1 Tax=Ureibacillus sp. GCM10028918 TaxID=3273429 RepID=UPI00361F11D7
MFNKYLIFSFVFLFSFVNTTFAHTHIESSSPQSGEVLTEALEEITLTYEGKIEQSSFFTLQNAAGETVPVDNITVSENVLSGSLPEPIENGEYLINWNIIGADGHLIEGEVPFTVDVPVTETTTENAEDETVDQEVKDENNITTTVESETTNEDAAVDEPSENTSSSYLVPTLIGLLILIVAGSFFFIAKRKQ